VRRLRNRARDSGLWVGEPLTTNKREREGVRGWGDPHLLEKMREASPGWAIFPRILLMHVQIRCDKEDTRPFGGAGEEYGSSFMVGAMNRGVRVQVDELYRSEELAAGQTDNIAYLPERAGAASFFNFEGAFELTLQGSIVSVSLRVASGLT